ncbi:MCO3 [Drosophila busckii]|uniref:MCO3 n=1 Tax=Drosophila busckii TaxID=30019 RepID=A0A0M4FAU2_DROBS|nr:laccase-4 [Drosophila busckii]ALC49595.1 MCO3 [Drosophila busckii]
MCATKRIICLLLCCSWAQAQLESQEGKIDWPWTRQNKTQKVPLQAQSQSPVQLPNFDFAEMDISSFQSGFERHPCRRVCQQGQSQRCYYQLVVHNYRRLGAECQRCQYDERACAQEQCIYGDGVPNPVMAVNRQVPGPPIELCENDTVVVDVLNYLSEPTTMHWHGVHMSRTPEMDGVGYVTQYPVQPGEVYRYEFLADRSGTLWYHSHMGWQRGFGDAGLFLVRQPHQANPHARLYDYDLVEHALMVQDIFYDYQLQEVRNILINGKGRNHQSQLPDQDPRHRYERIKVTPGYRYRMRVVLNGVLNCPVEFSIEQHKLLIISADGNDIVPVLADGFFLTSAERFDFVLEANQYTKNFWIRLRGYEQCEQRKLYQGAVLSYRGAAKSALPPNDILQRQPQPQQGRSLPEPRLIINDYRYANATFTAQRQSQLRQAGIGGGAATAPAPKDVGTVSLRSLQPVPWPRYSKFLTYYSHLSIRQAANGELLFQTDEISFDTSGISLLQGRQLYRDDAHYCNRSSLAAQGRSCARETCECVHVIRLPAYRAIEIVVVNHMDSTHPIHMHGYTFRVVAQRVLGNQNDLRNIQELDRRGQLPRLSDDYAAVEKDTVQVPALGYVILRFISDNPGFWSYHCHIESHAIQGMTAVLKVGENHQMKRIPAKVRC